MIEEIEGPWAVIEWGKDSFRIPKLLLPSSAKPGDLVSIKAFVNGDSDRLRRKSNRSYVVEDLD